MWLETERIVDEWFAELDQRESYGAIPVNLLKDLEQVCTITSSLQSRVLTKMIPGNSSRDIIRRVWASDILQKRFKR